MSNVYRLSEYRRDEREVRAAMRRHPSSRRTVTLTPKGERWLTNAYTTLVLIGTLAAIVLVMGLVGAIETAGL